MIYAAQFRDMHTAGHRLLIVRPLIAEKAKAAANAAVRYMHEASACPPHYSLYGEVVEIDYRKPPTEHKGEKLSLVNGKYGKYGNPAGVPDCYGS